MGKVGWPLLNLVAVSGDPHLVFYWDVLVDQTAVSQDLDEPFLGPASNKGGDIGFDTQVTLAENNGESWLASVDQRKP